MQLVVGSERIVAEGGASPMDGEVRWSAEKSLWIGAMTLAALVLAPLTFSWPALALFLATTGVTLCFGHSVGMHRRLIHGAFKCPLWLEYLCVYLGVLVGMAGPIGMTRIHDTRDWAQRQPGCHPFLRHGQGFWIDGWQQLHCKLYLAHPPRFAPEPRIADDRFYAFLERTWMLQQLPWALTFYALGGWGWVVWGVCARVAVSVTGQWLVGYFAHNEGGQHWIVDGAAVQGHDVAIAGLISFGESWHNNHHAFPGSAKLGLYPGQIDLGWALIKGFEAAGLAWDIVTPERLPARAALRPVVAPPVTATCAPTASLARPV
jgi:stearoyl-CoA desaturase (delta-9 desaturase)